jgi:hypothetical protein
MKNGQMEHLFLVSEGFAYCYSQKKRPVIPDYESFK